MPLDSILRVACGYASRIVELSKQAEPDGQYAAVMLSLLAEHASELRGVADRLDAIQEHALTCCEVVLAAFEDLEIPLNSALANCTEEERGPMLRLAASGFAATAKRQLPYLPVEFFCAQPMAETGGYEPYRAPPKASDILTENIKNGSTREVTVRDVGKHTGLSPSSVRRLVKEEGFPAPKATRPATAWSYEDAKSYVVAKYQNAPGTEPKIIWRD